jgi:hypothetical protein
MTIEQERDDWRDKYLALKKACDEAEPVARICGGWQLLFIGSNPIAEIVRKHGLKIGDALFTRPSPIVASEQKPVEYVHGDWFKAKTVDEMQAFFMSRLADIRAVAREHGYAIGLHGSTRRDFDLIAMPWRDGYSDKETLAHAIAQAACGIDLNGNYRWENKGNGRFAVSMCICWTDHSNPEFKDMMSIGHIDLSVVETAPPNTAEIEQRVAEACAKACENRGEENRIADGKPSGDRDEFYCADDLRMGKWREYL